jgi:DNA gyrase/topoisomerase IV subunit B
MGLATLRYQKVILATDADVDGLHIRNLMITYFFRFFDQLVHDSHLFVLETPLFRGPSLSAGWSRRARPN